MQQCACAIRFDAKQKILTRFIKMAHTQGLVIFKRFFVAHCLLLLSSDPIYKILRLPLQTCVFYP